MGENTRFRKVMVIHGPNLNMLGTREPQIYGHQTLEEINARLRSRADELELQIETFQTNHEGEMVEQIQQTADTCDGLLINPAAYTHTSVAVRDALAMLEIPVVEIHLSNPNKRESFRHTSLIADIATARISGFGAHGYLLALEGLAQMLPDKPSILLAETDK